MKYSCAATMALLVASSMAKTCINATVPVKISAQTGIFNIATPQTNIDATTFVLNSSQQGRYFAELALEGYQTTSGTYNISTQFCMPDGELADWSISNSTVQVLTHGIGFDKRYWDVSYNNYNYSYVDVATDGYKYCTLSYDRLGIGHSSHGEPLDEIQASLEVAALYELTMMLRAGTFPGVDTAFKKVVHVGHSFGSAQTYALVSMYPNISDGIVLTGFSMNGSFLGYFYGGANFVQANRNTPRLAGYPNGYLIPSDIEAFNYLLFYPGYFDLDILVLVENTKQPVTVGELLTLGSIPATSSYLGPVLVLTGEYDLPYCGGDCLATGNPSLSSIPAAVSMNFPNITTSNFEVYIQPNTGHAINLQYNATGSYSVIGEFLAAHGLESAP